MTADPDEVHNLALNFQYKSILDQLRTLVDGFVAENDRSIGYEDPLDIYKGFNGRIPEYPVKPRPS